MEFDLTQSCIDYLHNPEMGVNAVSTNYGVSIPEANAILKRKCANMLDDDQYSNLFGSKIAKERREETSRGKQRAKYSPNAPENCEEMEELLEDMNSSLDYETTKLVGAKKGATRVGTRTINALNDLYYKALARYDAMECEEEKEEQRELEEEQMLASVFQQAEQSRAKIKQTTNATTYIAIGVGALILLGGIMLAIKKVKNKGKGRR